MINKKATARLQLVNNGPIPADIIAIASSFPEDVFTVHPHKMNIDAYSFNYLTLTFIPSGILVKVFKYLTLNNFETISLTGL